MKRVVREQRLGYVATVCADGTPNLSPKGTTTVWDDDHLMFADIRSPQSVRNIEHNPSVEVNVVDPLVRKGYRFKGRGIVHRSDDVFVRGCRMYRDMGVTSEIRAVVLIRVDRAHPSFLPPTIGVTRRSRSKIDGAATGASCGRESKNDARGTVALLNSYVPGVSSATLPLSVREGLPVTQAQSQKGSLQFPPARRNFSK